jgi:hypothetical protein
MTLRGHLKRIEESLRGMLGSFELLDGSTYYYDRLETHKELFLYAYDVQLGRGDEWLEPPEVYRKMCEAKDPATVLERFKPENPQGAFVDPTALFERDGLVNERRLVPVSYEPPEDLSKTETHEDGF